MNLYELAHHPEAWKERSDDSHSSFWWGHPANSTEEQWDMLKINSDATTDIETASQHTDENEFRMHLLFVWWATLPDSEYPSDWADFGAERYPEAFN